MTEKPRLEFIFLKSLKYEDAEQRVSFLDEACAGDSALRAEVELLIQSHQDAGSFLEEKTPELLPTQLQLEPSGNRSDLEAMRGILGKSQCVSLRDDLQDDPAQRVNSKEIPSNSSQGRYQLQGEIARGGMGAIIKGRDTDLGRDLAVKVLLDSHKNKPDVVQRFVEEAQIGGQLQHPGIAPVYLAVSDDSSNACWTVRGGLARRRVLTALESQC